jgi:NADPH:quinone reductase-like Zn-dependent oxidoreductase
MPDFLVKRDDLGNCRTEEATPPGLAAGQALLRIERFGLTTNNVTYALFGDAMSYWSFFPASDGWGRVPMWGFARVEQSAAAGLEPGQRFYGYVPPSSHLVVEPASVDAHGFSDAAAHRAALPTVYQRYALTARDPFYRGGTEDLQMLLRPLFFTSFLIDDELADAGLATSGPVLFASASSKTAIAAAFLLSQRTGAEPVALTSQRNAAFIERLGIYDRTITYDQIASLERRPAAFVDMSDDATVRQAVHGHFADELRHSMVVGATHRDAAAAAGQEHLPGPRPAFFFAPDRANKRSTAWGAAGLQSRAADAWHPFCEWADGWLEVIAGNGFEAVKRAWIEVLDGGVPPDRAHVLSLI